MSIQDASLKKKFIEIGFTFHKNTTLKSFEKDQNNDRVDLFFPLFFCRTSHIGLTVKYLLRLALCPTDNLLHES